MRQNPHVRICGGPGSATTLVYPTADSVRDLRRILEHPTGKTVMTTIQKFQEITSADGATGRAAVHPTLSEAANIFVMVDEAHRTQYRSLAANMRQALPNACFLGFTMAVSFGLKYRGPHRRPATSSFLIMPTWRVSTRMGLTPWHCARSLRRPDGFVRCLRN